MKRRHLLSFCITAIVVLLLSSTVFRQEFSSPISKDTTLTITATGKQSKNSWGQSVRIRSILVDEKPVNLEDLLPFCNGFNIEGGFLTAYQIPATLNITLENAKLIELHLLGEGSSGYADIQIGNQKKEIDLHRQGGWHTIKWTHTNTDGFAPHLHPFKFAVLFYIVYSIFSFIFHISVRKRSENLLSGFFLLSGFSILGFQIQHHILLYVALSEVFFNSVNNILIILIILLTASCIPQYSHFFLRFLWSLCIVAATENLSLSGSVFLLPSHILFLNILIPLAVLYISFFFIGNSLISTCAVSVFMLLAALANHYTILFRGSPISPPDIFSIKTALNVIQNYKFSFNSIILVSILLVLFAIIIHPPRKKRVCWATRSLLASLSLLFIFMLNSTTIQHKFKFAENDWIPDQLYKKEGFYLTFFSRISDSFITKPDGFSNSVLQTLEEKYNCTPQDDNFSRPNVFVIMNESFADLESYDGFSASEPIMPYLYSLKGASNTHYGFAEVPVFGGNTCISEFEFLSGVNSLYYPIHMPYDMSTEKIDALPNVIKTLGYNVLSLHPYESICWSRNKGYPKIGFDQSIFSDTGMQHHEIIREYISDKSFYDEIMMLDQQIQDPLFLFGITMQNHGGYTFTPFDEPIQIVSPAGDYPLATQYINLIRESDRAFENFIDYYKKQEEPTIVLFFGDHLPKIENTLLDALHASHLPESGRDKLTKYHTPYYIWANFDLDKSQLPAEGSLISLSLLQSVLMKAASLPMTGYQQLLYQLLQQYPVISQHCILDADGNLVETESQNIPILKDYIHLQYALLKNKSDLFTFFK